MSPSSIPNPVLPTSLSRSLFSGSLPTTPPTPSQPSVIPSLFGAAAASKASSTKAPSSSGVSAGAAAGIAIGCFLAGALIGLAAGFILLRQRQKKRDGHSAAVARSRAATPQPATEKALPRVRYSVQLDQYLLDTTPDDDIAREMQALGELIRQHAESHYHARQVVERGQVSRELQGLGLTQEQSDQIAAMACNPTFRQAALQHVISTVVFSGVRFQSHSQNSLLPASMGSFLTQVAPASRNVGDGQALSMALTKWRRLSAFLLHPDRTMRTPLPADDRETQDRAGSLAQSLNRFLHFFVDSDQLQDQTTHLQQVILECTKLGYVMLSQPSTWLFVFEDNETRSWVVTPGLEKVSELNGESRQVLRPVSVPI